MIGNRRRLASLALLAVFLLPTSTALACDAPRCGPHDGPHVEPYIEVDGHRFRLAETRESVVARLGQPLERVEYDRGGTVYLIETFADGTEFGYRRDDGIVDWISTTSARARTFVPVAVGDRRDEVLNRVAGLVATGDSALLPVLVRPSTPPAPLWYGLILIFRGDQVARVSLSPLAE